MIIKCYNEKHPWLLFLDIEFDQLKLVQFSGALFKRIDEETYQLATTITQYITTSIGTYFQDYTNISQDFVLTNGIPLESLKDLIFGEVLKDISMSDILIISHGLKNDRLVLKENGINFSFFVDKDGITKPIDGYCTFNNAKRILEREKKLKLEDLAEDAGYYLSCAHNAYSDMWATISVFTFLRKIEYERKMLKYENN